MSKNTVILLAILILLLIVALLLLQRPGEQSIAVSEGTSFLEIDTLAVDRVEIVSASLSLSLGKRGTEWYVEKPIIYRADQPTVNSLIQQAGGLKIRATVSNKPEKHAMFQVDTAGTMVRIYEAGTPVASFVVGKMGPSFTDVYARKESSEEVVLIDGSISPLVNRQLKEWRDRSITNIPRETIRQVEFQYGDTTFVLALRDSVWMVGKDIVQEWTTNSLLSSLANLQADDFIDTPPAPSPRLVAVISLENLQLRFFQRKGSDSYYLQTSSAPQWFELQSWRANQVLKRKKDFTQP